MCEANRLFDLPPGLTKLDPLALSGNQIAPVGYNVSAEAAPGTADNALLLPLPVSLR